MKRKNYLIKCNMNDFTCVKHTWNAARKEIVAYMRTRANLYECQFNEVKSKTEKDLNRNHIKGCFFWQNNSGMPFEFTIELVD